ncbi:MAG: hypothetical protein NC937_05105, partial [Candidatus Omnitrophica bacterium]|nr:hypothetical protein [Candidatus Omnitrophota bacterium]
MPSIEERTKISSIPERLTRIMKPVNNQYLDGIWGEDWPGYEVWLRGGDAYLVDMMRCQAKGLPVGIYNVVEANHSPVYARYKFFQQLINGITEIFWYSYGCLRGNESNPWEIKTDIVR